MDFATKHKDKIIGTLSGFDRMLFRGILQKLHWGKGMYSYMKQTRTPLFDLEKHLNSESQLVKDYLENLAKRYKAGFHYLNNSYDSKSERAKSDLEKNPNKKGLISIIRVLEVSPSFSLKGNRTSKELEIVMEPRRHLHYYLYFNDPEFGWMFVHLQGRCPYVIKVYVNGREYLKKALDKEGVKYKAYDNSLTYVKDLDLAQSLLDNLIDKKWSRFLNAFARLVNPLAKKMETTLYQGYQWYTAQSEFATDIMFRCEETLNLLYPHLVQHATMFRGAEDIYSFFGRRLDIRSNRVVKGKVKKYEQGFRVKHIMDSNSIKMYTKTSVLRVETTINKPGAFKIYKESIRKGTPIMAWVPMGKAVSNLYRHAQVAQQGNDKYLDALTVINMPDIELKDKVKQLSNRVLVRKEGRNDRYYSAFNLLTDQTCLILEAINNAKFCIQPFSNKSLREILITSGVLKFQDDSPKALKKLSAKVTRLIAKLRAHNLVQKIEGSFKYNITKTGKHISYQVLAFKNITLVKQ